MQRILSTYLFVHRKLTPALLAEIARAGIGSVEIFCARAHFDYRSPETARELAIALRDHNLEVHAVHAPAVRDLSATHESEAPLSISEPERVRRTEAVDEIKRALDLAEYFPFPLMVQHLGGSREPAEPRRFDAAAHSLEHLRLFAKQRGVTIALENTPGELATPANLRQLIADNRFTDLRFCFDIGHAHLSDEGVAKSWEEMRDLVVTAHIHDNHGEKDEHLPPLEPASSAPAAASSAAPGGVLIDWSTVLPLLANSPLALELKEQPAWAEPAPPGVALDAVQRAFDRLAEQLAKGEPD